ncbi:Ribosomal RNA small subunit methyltransferase NEP1 [Oopsacas minuta]|uniref:Ribosomal RNA small subunit methyltransferase NEP1 n=1 Tax=Oopsacas minuta TaxID=111878 RepID=A0AAV7JV78_9METZ|nr:Ribosomal RNA small subunit methyltransferase NEP1 [Oopsacas minuta]
MAARFPKRLSGKKRRKLKQMAEKKDSDEEPVEEYIPVPKRLNKDSNDKRLIVILEGASIETGFTKRDGYQLLTSDKHHSLLTKEGRDPSLARPDIVHQCLLMLLDSPLNQAGLLQIFIHTEKNVLIQISPQTRIPRTFDRFCGVMVQLLQKLVVRAAGNDSHVPLLKIIKNPITDHLPTGCLKIGTSHKSKKFVDPLVYATDEKPIVFVIGAFAHGSLEERGVSYTEETVSISNYPLSAAYTCAVICSKFTEAWNIDTKSSVL